MFPGAARLMAVGSATMGAEPAEEYCATYQRAIELVGRRWTGEIVRALLAGKTRFSEFTATIPGLSDRLLSERLKDLETEGIVQRCVSPDTPVRVDYRLTDKGEALGDVVDAVSAWAERWVRAGSG
jgi:DNA-binding HxlR family transcriptional regulator